MTRLAPPERHRHLLDLLDSEGKIIAASAASHLGVSEDTIRRDLRDLADAGLLRRFHGGAVRAGLEPEPFQRRVTDRIPNPSLIERGLALLRPSSTVLFDQSTLLLALARRLPAASGIRLITPSPDIALAALDAGLSDVVLIGGPIDPVRRSAAGATALENLSCIRADQCFLGVCAIEAEAGVMAQDCDDAALKRAMLDISSETIALVATEKVGTVMPFRVSGLGRLDRLVVDGAVPPSLAEACTSAGVVLDVV